MQYILYQYYTAQQSATALGMLYTPREKIWARYARAATTILHKSLTLMKLRLPKNLICALMAAGSMACIAPASASTDWLVTDTSHAEEAVTLNNGDVLKLLNGSGAGSGTTFTSGLITVNSGGQLFVHGWTTGQKNVNTGNKMKIASPVLLAGGTIHQEDGSYYFTKPITVSGTGNTFESSWAKGVVFEGFSKDADDADPQSSTLVIRQNDSTDGGYSTFTISGASSYEGTVQQVNNDGDVRMHLILAHSDALRNAHLQTLSADQKSRGDVLLNVQSANVRALSGSGTIAVARKQNDNVDADGNFFVSTLHVLGADNKTFSGTLAPGVSLAIGVDAAQTLSAATLGGTVVNEGSLTLQGTSTLTTSDMSSFMVKSVTASTADGANGFATTATGTYYVIRNHGALDGADDAITGAVKDEAGHYVTEVDIAPESLYVVNSDMTYSGTASAGDTKPGNILINSGVLDVTGGNSGQNGFINGQVYVHGGATLKLSRHDVMGYWSNGNATRAIHLMGESESQRATLEINNAGNVMTSSTDMWLQGHATVSGSAFNAYAGNVYVLGTDNIISAEMQLRKNAIVFVEKDGSVEFTGGITYNTSNEGRSLIKSGAGLLTLDSQSQASRINNLTINEGTMRVHSALTTEGTVLVEQGATLDLGNGDKNLLKNATGAGNVTVSKNITMAEGESTQATGTLTVQGASSAARTTLRVQPNGTNAGSVSSFSAYVLDNGVLEFINKGGMRQLTLEKLTVKGYSTLGTVDDSTCWHGTYNIGALIGAAGSSLELVSGSWVGNTTVFNLNGGTGSNFRGDLLLKMNQNSGTTRRVAANINSGAETLLQDSVVTLDSKNSNDSTAIGLGINTNATLKGLETAANPSGGIFYIFSGAAGNNASEYDSDNTPRTLTLGHGTTADDSYTFAGKVKRNLNLVKEGLGTQVFSGDMSGFNKNITVKGGTLHFAGNSAFSADSLLVTGSSSEVIFDHHLTLNGNARVDIASDSTERGNDNTAYFKDGVTYTGTGLSGFAFVVGNSNVTGNELKLGGASDLNGKHIGVYAGSSLILEDGAALSNVGNIQYGNGHAVNGTVTLGTNSSLTFTRNANLAARTLTNGGTITARGTASAPITLTLNIYYGTQDSATDAAHTANLGKLVLDNATLKNNSDCESAVRNISELIVDGASGLSQNSWNTFWNIAALNKGTAEGERTLTWTAGTTHWTNSVLSLTGAGDFDGTFHAHRTDNPSTNGYHQAYVEIAHQDALKDAVLNATGTSGSYMTVALDAAKVNIAGLQGNGESILLAGEANKNIGSSSNKQGDVIPASSGTAELSISSKNGSDDEFAGKVLGGISITKGGAGTQTFSGDMRAFNGNITVTDGTLALGHTGSTTTVVKGSRLTVNGGTLNVKAGSVLDVQINANANNFVLANGGKIAVETGAKFADTNWWLFAVEARGSETATMSTEGTKTGYAFDRDDIEIAKAKVTYTASSSSPTVKNLFTDSAIVKSGTGTLTVDNADNTLVGVDASGGSIVVENAESSAGTLASIKAEGGDVTIKGLQDAVVANLNELYIADRRTVSAYQDSGATEGNVSVSGTLTAGSGANLNANLTVKSGATIDVAEGGLHMGSSLTLSGNNIGLSQSIVDTLNNMSQSLLTAGSLEAMTGDRGLTLFTGVDAFNLGGSAYNDTTTYHAGDYFNLAGVNRPWDYVIKFEADAATDGGTVSLYMETPEPATATLSLLALAALAAKRKRK